MRSRSLLACLSTLVLLATALTFSMRPAQDAAVAAQTTDPDDAPFHPSWPMFGGSPERNLVNLIDKNIPIDWDVKKKKRIQWTADLGSNSHSGPIIAGGQIYVGTNNQKPRDPADVDETGRPIDMGVLMCFRAKDGAFLWQIRHPKLPSGRIHDWPYVGLASYPKVEGNSIYYVSNRCELVAASTAGKVLWKLDMMKELGVFPHNMSACSPLIVGDWLFVVTANGVAEGHIRIPSPLAPSFIKVHKITGKVAWKDNSPTARAVELPPEVTVKAFQNLVNRAAIVQHAQWSNPAFANVQGQAQIVFPGGDGWLRAFDLDGKLLWKFDANPKDATFEIAGKGTRNDFVGAPVIYKNRVYIGLGQDPEHETGVGHFWCIDMTKRGDVSPELVTDDTVWPPKTKPNPNSAAVWHYGGVIPPPLRGQLGRNYYIGRTMSTCAIADELVYISELSGWLHCLDAATGKLYWSHDTGAMSWSSPYFVDNKVYFGNDDGVVSVFAHGKECKVLAEIEMPGRVRVPVVAAGGVLYVQTENRLFAIAADK